MISLPTLADAALRRSKIHDWETDVQTPFHAASRPAALLKLGLYALLLATAACTGKTPSGQVVATVNGKEVTNQDLIAEARSAGLQGQQDPRIILQRVIARELLAQSAHDRKLDAYPGYPADILRLQQNFLAQKTLQAVVKAPGAPKPAEVSAFMAAHPFIFANRMKIQLDEVRFQTTDNLKSMNGADTLQAVISRLKTISTPFDRQTRTFDTAQLPGPMAENIATAPVGKMFFVKEGETALAMTVLSREAVSVPTEQQVALASQALSQQSTQHQVDGEINRLRAQAKIVYQPNYAPPTHGAGAAPSDPAPAVPASAPTRNPAG